MKNEQEPLSLRQSPEADTYFPLKVAGEEQAEEVRASIIEELRSPETLSPKAIYSMTLTRIECALQIKQQRIELADEILDAFQSGIQAMMANSVYNSVDFGELRYDLFQGYLQQLEIVQSLTREEIDNDSTPQNP